MKNLIRIISMLLTVLLLLGSMTVLSAITVYAADETGNAGNNGASGDGTTTTPEEEDPNKSLEEKIESYKTTIYITPEDKIATMGAPKLVKGDYELYIDSFSGEVALKNTVTNEYLFSNPYDIGASKANESEDQTKEELLSQIIVNFTSNGNPNQFYSFREAAARNQIKVKNIKNGIRVEYTIGREQSKLLLPRVIEASEFEKLLASMVENASPDPKQQREDLFNIEKKFTSYYTKYDPNNMIESMKAQLFKKYPVMKNKGMAIYVFDPTASEVELTKCEDIVKTFAPDYTYEMLDEHHAQTEYESEDLNPPLFKMALEYTLDDNGLSVRLPANGIRFNESLYQLDSIEILPYMGAGNNAYNGYNVFPDGSGATFDYQDLNIDIPKNVNGKIYGKDYAYHSVTGQYQKSISYPVFGAVEETTYYTYNYTVDTPGDTQVTVNGGIVQKYADETYTANDFRTRVGKLGIAGGKTLGAVIGEESNVPTIKTDKRGFMAIIEDGDALTQISTVHPGTTSEYNSLQMSVTPRPTDTYTISGSLSVNAANNEYTVVCDRKYVGSYKIRYILLSDHNDNLEEGQEEYDCYDTSWFGMAVAYRDYLMSDEVGILSPLKAEQLTDDIPLYIESFGALETLQKVLSVPVKTMTALTTFEDIQTMYENLSAGGVKNINFKLKGYANGGLESTVPYKFNIESAVGGEKGFQQLLDYAAQINANEDQNLGIFPDFDFAYVKYKGSFDGLNERKHIAKTIDDRYSSKREYSATQGMVNYYELAISPAYFNRFYEKIKEHYLDEYENVYGISVSTLGSALNSDFDEDEPYNREDSKDYTEKAFAHFDENYAQVMTDVGNAYSWKYVDHILNVALDSSRYNISKESIPFIGIVLHGSIQFAGSPMNMEGNMDYAMLKAIENGASPYFILSYRNTQNLKENNSFSKYYSVRYDIWKDDLIETYNKLNDALYDVQDKFIIAHDKVEGALRVPDLDEIEADLLQKLKEYAYNQEYAEIIKNEQARFEVSIARDTCRKLLEDAVETYEIVWNIYDAIITGNGGSDVTTLQQVTKRYQNYVEAFDKFEKLKNGKTAEEAEAELYAAYEEALAAYELVKAYEEYKDSKDPAEEELYKQATDAKKKMQAAEKTYNSFITAKNKVSETLDKYLMPFTRLFKDQEVVTVNAVSYKAKDINALIEKMYDKLELAVEYIEIIAEFENTKISYEEGKEGDVMAILNVDSLPRFTKKAVEQAQEAYTSIISDKFVDSTQSIELDGSKIPNFPIYNDEGVIENYQDYGPQNDRYRLIEVGEDIFVYRGNSPTTYKFYKAVWEIEGESITKDYDGIKDVNGNVCKPVRVTVGGDSFYVVILPYAEEVIHTTDAGVEIYRFLKNDGTYIYYSKNEDGSLKDHYLPVGDDSFTKITPEVYSGDAVSTDGATIYVLRNEEGTLLTVDGKANGDILYVSGTDYNNYHTYMLTGSVSKMRDEYNASIEKIIKDTAAIGQVTEEEFKEYLAKTDVDVEEDDDNNKTDDSKYATDGIVAVTYGTLEGEAYKTMLLNYNNYAVNITYNGKNYTIPAYDFVVIKI